MEGYTKQLAGFTSKLDYKAIPEEIVARMKWVILDNLGNIVGGTAIEFGKTIAAFTRGLGDRAEATVLGFGFKTSARHAGFALDFEAVFVAGIIRPREIDLAAAHGGGG